MAGRTLAAMPMGDRAGATNPRRWSAVWRPASRRRRTPTRCGALESRGSGATPQIYPEPVQGIDLLRRQIRAGARQQPDRITPQAGAEGRLRSAATEDRSHAAAVTQPDIVDDDLPVDDVVDHCAAGYRLSAIGYRLSASREGDYPFAPCSSCSPSTSSTPSPSSPAHDTHPTPPPRLEQLEHAISR